MKINSICRALPGLVVAGLIGWSSGTSATAHSFVDPIQLSKGLLNMYYPESLHVTGAVWEAQKAGVLPMPDKKWFSEDSEERKRFEDMVFQEAVWGLLTFGTAIEKRPSELPTNLAIVLVDAYLWARIELDGKISIHVPAAHTGDLVIVTEEPVIRAVVGGNLSVAEALDMGVMKLYGSQDQINAFTASKASLGNEPLWKIAAISPRWHLWNVQK